MKGIYGYGLNFQKVVIVVNMWLDEEDMTLKLILKDNLSN